uniref:Uncharacterized protein n=1 Tax=viral metagenome TaxID=1070528 RepID=A0A6M3KIU8_9ZZZZ
MKRLIFLIVAITLLMVNPAYAEVASNFSYGVIDTSNTLADAEAVGDTFAVLMSATSTDLPTGAGRVVVYTSTCSAPSSCTAREIVTYSVISCAGTSPNRICTATITARNQESTTHSGDWVSGAKVAMAMTKGAMDGLYCPLALTTGYIFQGVAGVASPVNSLNIATIDMSAQTSSIPWIVGTSTWPTVEGSAKWDSANDELKIGDSATTKTISPRAVVTNHVADATITCKNGDVHTNYGSGIDIVLKIAALTQNANCVIKVMAAYKISVEPNVGTDTLVDFTSGAGKGAYTSTLYDQVTFVSYVDAKAVPVNGKGTWIEYTP